MRYDNITRGIFVKRPNRFIAEVDIEGRREIVHVKNTGRSKKREKEFLENGDFRKAIEELASEHGGKVWWDEPLGAARQG